MKSSVRHSGFATLLLVSISVQAGPQEDLKIYQNYFHTRFPALSPADLANGSYNFNEDKKQQWLDIMEFPPYEAAIEEGKELFTTPFANGKTYGACLENGGIAIAHTYPRFNAATGKVENLTAVLNACRQQNNEKPLDALKGDLAKILAYLASTSRDKIITVTVPNDPRAQAAYEDGKRIYFTRRGPREFACYHCHWQAAGTRIRGNDLSPAVGQATHFPTYRSEWGEVGTLQWRYKGCMNNIGAVPLKEQSDAMNNLEYFHTFISNGIPMNAPGTRF